MKVIKSTEKPDGYNLDFIEKQAKMVMEIEGKHQPFAILSSRRDIYFCPMIFNGNKEKQIIKKMLREFVHTKKIERYWIIMESWVSHNQHIDSAGRDINRKEVLCTSEFSSEKMNGKMVANFFERDDKKIIWKGRVLLEGESEGDKESFRSPWNFYKEDISKDIDVLREKARIADLVMRTEHADISDEIKIIREMWKRDKGADLELTDNKIKEQLIEVIKTGKMGFKNAIIPEKFRMNTDKDIDNLNQILKKRRENK